MGMELYANSAVARAVWDMADAHLGEVYGFSILEIVRSPPHSFHHFLSGRRIGGPD